MIKFGLRSTAKYIEFINWVLLTIYAQIFSKVQYICIEQLVFQTFVFRDLNQVYYTRELSVILILFHQFQLFCNYKFSKLQGIPSYRSTLRRCSVKKLFLKNLQKFTWKHLCQSLFLSKAATLRPTTLLKKKPWHGCFSTNFAKVLRTPFLTNTSGDCFSKKYPLLLKHTFTF